MLNEQDFQVKNELVMFSYVRNLKYGFDLKSYIPDGFPKSEPGASSFEEPADEEEVSDLFGGSSDRSFNSLGSFDLFYGDMSNIGDFCGDLKADFTETGFPKIDPGVFSFEESAGKEAVAALFGASSFEEPGEEAVVETEDFASSNGSSQDIFGFEGSADEEEVTDVFRVSPFEEPNSEEIVADLPGGSSFEEADCEEGFIDLLKASSSEEPSDKEAVTGLFGSSSFEGSDGEEAVADLLEDFSFEEPGDKEAVSDLFGASSFKKDNAESKIGFLMRRRTESVGIWWDFREPGYCICGYTPLRSYDDVDSLHGCQYSCNVSDRKEVEALILRWIKADSVLFLMECHHIYLKYKGKSFHAKFCSVPGDPSVFFHITGTNVMGIPRLDITDRDRLLEYAKKVGSLFLDTELEVGIRRRKLKELLNI